MSADIMPGDERRIMVRHPVRPGVKVAFRRSAEEPGPNLAVEALNLSEYGIRLLLRDTLARGDRILLRFAAEELPEAIECEGKVVWFLELPAFGYYYAGVRFDQPLTADQLARLIAPPTE